MAKINNMIWIKRLLKAILAIIVLLIVLFAVLYFMYNKPLPQGKTGAEATALVQKIQNAINQTAWDSTHYVEWSFRGEHHYIWDKKRHLVQVKWGEYKVLLNPNKIEGIVYLNNKKIENAQSLVSKANTFFINDAFWLNAPAQIAGSDRKLEAVTLDNGDKALLITYLSGGVTPGDSYLWLLDENGLPKAWQMWVGIIPIGGLEVGWSEWTSLATGAKIATLHDGGLLQIPITNIKTYQTIEAEKDIFEELVTN